jgi:ABC-2 type transport system ATP-binding protein
MVATEPPPAVQITGVAKTFGHTSVIHDLNLDVPGGQIFGLIGPSGGGKSTIVRMLVGVYAPSSGSIRVMGATPHSFTTAQRQRIGYTPQGFVLYPSLTVKENANFVAGMYGMGPIKRRKPIRNTLEFLDLWDARGRLAHDISGGMQRRLALACALVHDPDLLIIDEPTAGLDPVLRERIWGLLRDLRDQGKTVLVTTQYLDEAAFCDTVAILNKGSIATVAISEKETTPAVGPPEQLRTLVTGGELVVVEAERLTKEEVMALLKLPGVHKVEQPGPTSLRVLVDSADHAAPLITEALVAQGANVTAVRPHVPSFDEVFMKIVGHAS